MRSNELDERDFLSGERWQGPTLQGVQQMSGGSTAARSQGVTRSEGTGGRSDSPGQQQQGGANQMAVDGPAQSAEPVHQVGIF